jgi:hypothetical protein
MVDPTALVVAGGAMTRRCAGQAIIATVASAHAIASR